MDDSVGTKEGAEKKVKPKGCLGSCCRLVSTFLGIFSLSILVLFVAVFVGNLSIWNPITVHTQCQIVSSSVDLRSSKVCELGLLNYRAKRVFYPHEKRKFRCHYDYYWAAVFQVKYLDRSGQERLGLSEIPYEALPLNCRTSFGVAWFIKDKFKVNDTYGCWYALGISEVNIQHGGLLNCQADDPSAVEMLRRYVILSMRVLTSWFTSFISLDPWRLDVVAGLSVGFASSLITIVMLTILRQMMSSLWRYLTGGRLAPFLISCKRACFFVTYFTFMGWLTLEYVKRMGMPEIIVFHYGRGF